MTEGSPTSSMSPTPSGRNTGSRTNTPRRSRPRPTISPRSTRRLAAGGRTTSRFRRSASRSPRSSQRSGRCSPRPSRPCPAARRHRPTGRRWTSKRNSRPASNRLRPPGRAAKIRGNTSPYSGDSPHMPIPFKGRREDFRLVTGQGRYTSDWNRPNQAYGFFLRADRAHAEIVSLDTSEARAMPGVIAILTGEDIAKAGYKSPPTMVAWPGKGGMKIRHPARPVLAQKKVRHIGEEIALVVADTLAQAQDAAEAITVNYRDLPAVIGPAEASKPGAALLHDDVPENVVFDYEYGDAAAVEAAFAKADHIVKLTLDSQRLVGNPMEPKACLATYDAKGDIYEVYAPSQGMSMMQGALSAITGVPAPQIRAHAYDVGGGFGIRGGAYPEYAAVMLAAKTVGRPVKWVSTRSETMM